MALNIIYDGQCDFCLRSIEILKKLDSFACLKFYNSHDREILENKFPLVKPEDTDEAMFAVTEKSVVFKGFYAFRRLMWACPWLWPAVPIFYLPGSSAVGTRVYSWVARNRRKFGCRVEVREC